MSDAAWLTDIHEGDAAATLAQLPDSSVHMCMTSPPYYGLRDYDVEGQIGLEETLDDYIAQLVEVGTELKRVLRDDGSWWLNLGDSFAGSGRGQWATDESQKESYTPDPGDLPDQQTSLARKSKMLVPHRVALALQDQGWIVRSDAIWQKPNPLPHPVKDRLHEHKEYVFHLTPDPDYWFDLDAIREPHNDASLDRHSHEYGSAGIGAMDCPQEDRDEQVVMTNDDALHPKGKNPGDIIEVSIKPSPEAHTAVYPPELCDVPIRSSCPPTVCAECGRPYERSTTETAEWEQACECATNEAASGIVLDPFAGAGTTLLVAKQLGRRFAGIELNPDSVALAQKRVGVTVDDPERLLDDDETCLRAFTDGGTVE